MFRSRLISVVAIGVTISLLSLQANPIPVDPIDPVDDKTPSHSNGPVAIIAIATTTAAGLVAFLNYKGKKNDRRIASENIRFEVGDDDAVLVNATYRLQGIASNRKGMNIFYPLPNGSDSLVSASAGPSTADVQSFRTCRNGYDGYDLRVELDQNNAATLSVSYAQKPGNQQCRYILLTTKQWRIPIGSADFTITLPKGKKLTRCTYAYERQSSTQGNAEYAIRCTALWPEKDFEFAWE
jgi:hypothetical protein